MKIALEIPDWVEKENIYLLTINELIAYKFAGSKWCIKLVRCSKCGRCCEVHPKNGAYFPLKKDGSCVNLKEDQCKLGMEKPLACVLGEPTGKEHELFNCSIEY